MEIINTGEKVQYFHSLLSEDIGIEAANNVLVTARNILANAPEVSSDNEKKLGLLYGLIQSGKTNIINMTVSLAADNGYKLFIILTDRNNSLQTQTYERADEAIAGMLVRKMDEISGEDSDFIEIVLENDGIVLVCKKDPADMDKLTDFLKGQELSKIPVLIADDEADAVGLNTKQRMEDGEKSLINQKIIEVRNLVKSHLYLQVTATPQAIILQNKEDGGFHPEFIEVVEAGNGYTGIHTFFQENKLEHIRDVDKTEVETLADKELEEDISQLPEGLLRALSNFVMGATIKILENNESRDEQKFSFLCHISPLQQIHERIEKLSKKYIQNVYVALKKADNLANRDFILKHLSSAYDDLKDTNPAIPEFPDILKTLSDNINSHEVIVLNSAPASDSDIKLTKKFNFIIGGNKLGRGLTIPRLLVSYYGRISAKPQVDTLMQHARMCGYRSNDLTVTRLFIPDDIATLFEEICEHDSIQRDIIINGSMDGTLYLNSDKLSPTRPSVIPKSVGAYKAGQATFPKLQIYKKEKIEPITKVIDAEIMPLNKQDEILEMDIKTAIEIIKNIPVETSGGWHPEVISKTLSWYMENSSLDKIQFVYTLDRSINLSKSRGSEVIGSALSSDVQVLVRETDAKRPLLVLIRNNGLKWDGQDFWIPWFRFPENETNILFNLNNI